MEQVPGMVQELFYTSAPAGLRPGTHGFCVVAATRGMSRPLLERLESLSGYRAALPADTPDAARHPVNHAHWHLSAGGREYHVLSRVCFAGFDYSGRSNKFAHHLALDDSECPEAGPAWLLARPGVMETAWSGEPRFIDTPRRLPSGDAPAAPAAAWRAATGDAGWAGVVAQALAESSRPVGLAFGIGAELLPLVAEVLALLPPAARWATTFSTYLTDPPTGLDCRLRCYPESSPLARTERKRGVVQVFDLAGLAGQAPDTEWTHRARTGAPAARSQAPKPAPTADAAPEVSLPLSLSPDAASATSAVPATKNATVEPAAPLAVPSYRERSADTRGHAARSEPASTLPAFIGGLVVGIVVTAIVMLLAPSPTVSPPPVEPPSVPSPPPTIPVPLSTRSSSSSSPPAATEVNREKPPPITREPEPETISPPAAVTLESPSPSAAIAPPPRAMSKPPALEPAVPTATATEALTTAAAKAPVPESTALPVPSTESAAPPPEPAAAVPFVFRAVSETDPETEGWQSPPATTDGAVLVRHGKDVSSIRVDLFAPWRIEAGAGMVKRLAADPLRVRVIHPDRSETDGVAGVAPVAGRRRPDTRLERWAEGVEVLVYPPEGMAARVLPEGGGLWWELAPAGTGRFAGLPLRLILAREADSDPEAVAADDPLRQWVRGTYIEKDSRLLVAWREALLDNRKALFAAEAEYFRLPSEPKPEDAAAERETRDKLDRLREEAKALRALAEGWRNTPLVVRIRRPDESGTSLDAAGGRKTEYLFLHLIEPSLELDPASRDPLPRRTGAQP